MLVVLAAAVAGVVVSLRVEPCKLFWLCCRRHDGGAKPSTPAAPATAIAAFAAVVPAVPDAGVAVAGVGEPDAVPTAAAAAASCMTARLSSQVLVREVPVQLRTCRRLTMGMGM